METRTVGVSSVVAEGLAEAIHKQVAAIKARGGTVVSVQLTPPPGPAPTASDGQPAFAAKIAYTDGEPTAPSGALGEPER